VLLALLVLVVVATALAVPIAVRAISSRRSRRARRRLAGTLGAPLELVDPGRARRAEQRARELLRSCVNEEEWSMYRDLGFIRVEGRRAPYAYLIYPHKPIVAYVPETGRILNEYCVEFPDLTGVARVPKLPDSDDVLAKWMALTGDERRLIRSSNMHLPGRQIDPGRVRRDLWRLSQWERERAARRGSRLESGRT
jgi:hypothetical protein